MTALTIPTVRVVIVHESLSGVSEVVDAAKYMKCSCIKTSENLISCRFYSSYNIANEQ